MDNSIVGSIILAAGRGSRMKEFSGNKTLLPLVPGDSPFRGREPILLQILQSLPPGPKALVVHHDEREVMRATRGMGLTYCHQPALNGTGGALLAARDFLRKIMTENIILTMGDIPLVLPDTYLRLASELEKVHMVILGFQPLDKKQYGVLDISGNQVKRIIEWKYWKDFSGETREALRLCNSGIYAVSREILLPYLDKLASNPHRVLKEIQGIPKQVEEYFITDLVEYLDRDGIPVGYIQSEDEREVMGVDDLTALKIAQQIYRRRFL
jgi:bifunctional UDP-N-acetylglucosamine pyrophosphorylase/glucosamine-1-phosphate N-acetyltransferase